MDTKKAIEARRSIRKFTSKKPPKELYLELIRLGRLYSSAINAQPIRFALITEKENTDFLFENLNWAMRLHPYPIKESERAAAYLLLLGEDKENPFFEFDAGSCAATVMLAAESMGIASCCLKITKRDEIRAAFRFSDYIPCYAIALGYAGVKSEIVDAKDSLAYYLSPEGDFRVPKMSAKDLLIYHDDQELQGE